MIKGTVKFFNNAKGFGFIAPDDGSKDVFLPAATIMASGVKRLKAGQRVSFEHEPDVKGTKAVQLKLLDEQPVPVAAPIAPIVPIVPVSAPRISITVYHDPDSDESEDVQVALEEAGHEARLVDYTVTPPDREELKRMSFLLREADQSLVRRYDRLFLELQLDDRFIAENEFWTAIVEHPLLINGPVLTASNKVAICKTAEDVRAFLGLNGSSDGGAKRKGISARMAAMIGGHAVPPRPVQEVEEIELPLLRAVARAEPKLKVVESEPEPKPELKAEPKRKPKPEPEPEPKSEPKPKAKKAAVPVRKAVTAPAKKPAAKPAKKVAVVKAAPAKKKKK
jgi:arsenate reductase (glutaredoxin)